MYVIENSTFVPVVARMCWTCLFHATALTSSKGWALAPGVIGIENLFKSQIKISESAAPDANKLAWKGFRSKELTEPVCLSLLKNEKKNPKMLTPFHIEISEQNAKYKPEN